MPVRRILPRINVKSPLRDFKKMTPEQLKKWEAANSELNDELKYIWPKSYKFETTKPKEYPEHYLPDGDIFCWDSTGI